MGITSKQYFENIYNLMFSPFEFFDDANVKVSVRQAVGNVVFVTLVSLVANSVADYSLFDNIFLPFSLFFKTCGVLLIWFVTSLFFEYLHKIYFDGSKLSEILFYTSYAMLPYIFFAPLDILKNSGTLGNSFATFLQLALYFWIIFLHLAALKKVYNVTFARAFMIIFLPFVSTFFALWWAISFILKLGYINS